MKLNFTVNLDIDLTSELAGTTRRQWYFRNAMPKIAKDTKVEDLTEKQKISLIKLAIYEGFIDTEHLCNLPDSDFKIIPGVQPVVKIGKRV